MNESIGFPKYLALAEADSNIQTTLIADLDLNLLYVLWLKGSKYLWKIGEKICIP